jgi:hypothetical protein
VLDGRRLPRELKYSHASEELAFFADSEAIRVDPCAPCAFEGFPNGRVVIKSTYEQ